MGGLGIDEQFINRQATIFGESTKVHAELDDGEKVERLFRGHGVGISQNAVSATDLIPQGVRLLLNQDLPRVVLLLDDRLDHFAESRDNLVFLFAERGLIGNLKEV